MSAAALERACARAPEPGTIEAWAWDFVHATSLAHKLAPPEAPSSSSSSSWEANAPARRTLRPGRPNELVTGGRGVKTTTTAALRDPSRRAELLHTFLHHELQAAELMCWALLAFPDAPLPFRRGLLGICHDELRHMRMYGEHIERLGSTFGALPVNDWFWERVPQAPTAAHFVASMGIGFEGGNLDHAARFAERFRAAGDTVGAELQARVADEEVPHVAFATHWFRAFTGDVAFDTWTAYLPVPLSPMIMRGRPMNEPARVRAGFPAPFLERLRAW